MSNLLSSVKADRVREIAQRDFVLSCDILQTISACI